MILYPATSYCRSLPITQYHDDLVITTFHLEFQPKPTFSRSSSSCYQIMHPYIYLWRNLDLNPSAYSVCDTSVIRGSAHIPSQEAPPQCLPLVLT